MDFAAAPVKVEGTVSRWTDRGFGFITPNDGGEDLFCHFSNIDDGNGLEPGSIVIYVKVYDERKGKERAEQVTGGITVERNTDRLVEALVRCKLPPNLSATLEPP